jgi:hypothetical protein
VAGRGPGGARRLIRVGSGPGGAGTAAGLGGLRAGRFRTAAGHGRRTRTARNGGCIGVFDARPEVPRCGARGGLTTSGIGGRAGRGPGDGSRRSGVGRIGGGPARPGYDPADMSQRIGVIACAVFGAAAVGAAAQEGAGATSKPTSGPTSRRTRPEWKASLALPVDLWVDATAETIGETGDWTNKAEIGDVDGDGRPDLLFANGGDYDKAGAKVRSRVFLNRGRGAKFEDATKAIFGETTTFARAIKVRDVSGDGIADVFVANTYGLRCRLYLGLGAGKFKDATETHLPNVPGDFGDVECGDADGDGDLDLALAAWGDGSPMKNDGGRTALWLNDGAGKFTDATAERMPDVKVKFCWELEWVDVDGDFDLDLLVSAKRSKGSFLFENDGTGRFKDVSAGRLPQFTNNYEFEAMDVDGDGVMDLVTINDGTTPRFSEHLFRGDGKGGFVDATAAAWPTADNPSFDDNMIAFLDYDSDGDADFLIGSLDGPDRLLVNDGKGRFAAAAPVFQGDPTRGTLGLVVADLDGDGRLDVVHAQGENPRATGEKVFYGKSIAPDSAGPTVDTLRAPATAAAGAGFDVRVRVHDRKTPVMPHDFRKVDLVVERGGCDDARPARLVRRGALARDGAGRRGGRRDVDRRSRRRRGQRDARVRDEGRGPLISAAT